MMITGKFFYVYLTEMGTVKDPVFLLNTDAIAFAKKEPRNGQIELELISPRSLVIIPDIAENRKARRSIKRLGL